MMRLRQVCRRELPPRSHSVPILRRLYAPTEPVRVAHNHGAGLLRIRRTVRIGRRAADAIRIPTAARAVRVPAAARVSAAVRARNPAHRGADVSARRVVWQSVLRNGSERARRARARHLSIPSGGARRDARSVGQGGRVRRVLHVGRAVAGGTRASHPRREGHRSPHARRGSRECAVPLGALTPRRPGTIAIPGSIPDDLGNKPQPRPRDLLDRAASSRSPQLVLEMRPQ